MSDVLTNSGGLEIQVSHGGRMLTFLRRDGGEGMATDIVAVWTKELRKALDMVDSDPAYQEPNRFVIESLDDLHWDIWDAELGMEWVSSTGSLDDAREIRDKLNSGEMTPAEAKARFYRSVA